MGVLMSRAGRVLGECWERVAARRAMEAYMGDYAPAYAHRWAGRPTMGEQGQTETLMK